MYRPANNTLVDFSAIPPVEDKHLCQGDPPFFHVLFRCYQRFRILYSVLSPYVQYSTFKHNKTIDAEMLKGTVDWDKVFVTPSYRGWKMMVSEDYFDENRTLFWLNFDQKLKKNHTIKVGKCAWYRKKRYESQYHWSSTGVELVKGKLE